MHWSGDSRVKARSQSSIAVTADGGETWLLLNASPDLREQIIRSKPLSPDVEAPAKRRHSPIGAVLVTNGDVDHVAGLLTLRERQDFTLYGTPGVLGVISDNPIFQVLNPASVTQSAVAVGQPFEPVPGLEVEIFSVPGKVPLYLEKGDVDVGEEGEMTVGVRLAAGGRTAYYVPGCARVPGSLRERVRDADLLLFDGTVFHDDEMQRASVGEKTGQRMGHIPIAGEGGSLHAFDGVNLGRKAYIHINNTNPILIEGSEERRVVEGAGWLVTEDGMDFEL